MSKRRNEEDYDYFKRKIRKLERKLRHRRRSVSSESRQSSPNYHQAASDIQDVDDIYEYELMDDDKPDSNRGSSRRSLASVVVRQQTKSIEHPEESPRPPSPSPTSAPPAPPPQPPPAPLVTDSAAPPVVPTPSTSADCTPLLTDPAAPTDPSVLDTEVLDNELLEILGMDPTSVKTYGKDIQKDLSVRLEHYTTSGLSKELRKELKEKYLTPGNCKKIDPPELNAEIKAAITEVVEKRDKAIESKQRHLTTAITCVGAAITELLSSKEKHPNLLRSLMDAVRIMCDCQHADSVTRRKFLLNSVKKDMKEQLQNTKIDRFLFGENLSDTLKSAKAIVRSGSDLKQPAFKPQNKRTAPNSSNSLPKNWKGQSQGRRPPIPSKTKEPTATTTRGRPNTYSKQSHHPQQKSNYNRR